MSVMEHCARGMVQRTKTFLRSFHKRAQVVEKIPTSALVPSPFGSLEAASRTRVRMVTYGGRIEVSKECSRALLRLVSLLKTP